MSDDFDNDPYDEAPVHQLDEDGDVDFDESVGPDIDGDELPDDTSRTASDESDGR